MQQPATAPLPRRENWAGTVAWYSILACIALIPLVTSVGLSPSAQTWSYTADAYHVPKLLTLAILVSISSVAWLLDTFVFGRRLRWSTPTLLLGGLVVLVGISTAVAPQPVSSLLGASGLMTGAVTWLTCLWLGVLVSQYVESYSDLRALSWSVVAGATMVAIIVMLQALGADPLATPTTPEGSWIVTRGIATVGNPDFTGMLLVIPAAVALALYRSEPVPAFRWTAAGSCGLIAGALVVTLTRSAWVGLLIAALAFSWLVARNRKQLLQWGAAVLAVIVVLMVLTALVFSPELFLRRFTSISGGLDAFTSGRITLWGDAFEIIARRPLTGFGADRLALGGYEVQQSLEFTDAGQRLVLQDPHSMPLLVAGLFGVPAALALLTALGLTAWSGVKQVRTAKELTGFRTLYAGWVAGLLGFGLAAFLSVWTITSIIVLFVAFGVVSAPTLRRRKDWLAVDIVAAVLVFAVLGTTLFAAFRGFNASHHLIQARVADSQANLEQAIELTPWDAKTRTDYLFAKLGAYREGVAGSDARASRELTEMLDAEIRLAITDFPRELLLYRLRIDLYRAAEGAPGFQPELLREAIDAALQEFPDDPEFTKWRAQYEDAE